MDHRCKRAAFARSADRRDGAPVSSDWIAWHASLPGGAAHAIQNKLFATAVYVITLLRRTSVLALTGLPWTRSLWLRLWTYLSITHRVGYPRVWADLRVSRWVLPVEMSVSIRRTSAIWIQVTQQRGLMFQRP
eukprot:jgi/Ulvmu1/3121/UM015_0161.1